MSKTEFAPVEWVIGQAVKKTAPSITVNQSAMSEFREREEEFEAVAKLGIIQRAPKAQSGDELTRMIRAALSNE